MTSDPAGFARRPPGTTAHEYATAILRRGRDPMPPADFTPNWGDAPRRGKYYPDATVFPLPAGPAVDAGVDAALASDADRDEPFTAPLLAGMLHDSYGLLGRRLGIQANTDLAALPSYAHANWNRGTASGGGLYPCSIYWVAGPGADVTPGVYYYAHNRHAMQRLLAGDVTDRVRAALGGHSPAGQYLVIGVKYWQNSFKYNNFSYHAVTMDVGTLLQTWRMWATALGRRIRPVLWFDQAALGDLLGLAPDEEALFAVVPLTWAAPQSAAPQATAPGPAAPAPAASQSAASESATPVSLPGPRIHHADRERSRTRLTFDTLLQVHRSTAASAANRPAEDALAVSGPLPAPATEPGLPLPPGRPMTMPLSLALHQRRSSFGRFDAARRTTADQLAALLAAVATTTLPSEVGPDHPLAAVYAFVNHVEGVPAAAYRYDRAGHALDRMTSAPPGHFLQRNYFLANYNLEQAAVVLVPTIRSHAVLDATGDRGYNLVNATIGAVAQTFYTAAAALDLGAGVALGFDNVSYVEELELTESGEYPLLIMLAGHERGGLGDYRYELG